MSQALAMVPPQDTDIFTGDRLKLIRDKFANGAPQHEFDLFVEVCRTLNLDPLQRQVYLIPRNSKQRDGSYARTWTIQTSIDGYRALADRTGAYAGSDDAVFAPEYAGTPDTATVTVWKIVQGIRCPFTATARWAEYNDDRGPMWKKMPHTMLAKCSEALALRKAFPAQLAGVYTDSEMEQAGPVVREGRVVDVTTGEIIDAEATSQTIPASREIAPGRAVEPLRDQDDPQPGKTAQGPTSASTDSNARTPGGASVRSLNYSLVLADEAGIAADDIHRWCGDQFGKVSRNDLDQRQMSALIEWLQGVIAAAPPAADVVDLDRDEAGNLISWTAFWVECRALGVKSPAEYEAKVGAKQTAYPSPAAALAALKGTEG